MKDTSYTGEKIIESVVLTIEPDPDPDTSYLDQPEFPERREAWWNGDFTFVGIRAVCKYRCVTACGGYGPLQTVISGGLWGIESDSAEDYLIDVGKEEVASLKSECVAIGIDPEAFDREAKGVAPREYV